MNMAPRLWLLLFFFYASAHAVLSALVWRTFDLRLEVIVQYIAIPFLQAAGISWTAGGFNLKDAEMAVRQILSRPTALVLWCAEGVLLFLYWGPGVDADLSEIVARTAGIEALVAVVIILIRVLPGVSPRTWVAILPFSIVILVLGTNGVSPWLNVVLLWMPDGWSILLKQMVVLGTTVVSLIVFAGKAQGVIAVRSPLAGMMLVWVQLFFLVAAMALIINGYLFGFLASPWRQIIATFLSLATTSLLTAALCLLPGPAANRANIPLTKSQVLKRLPGFLRLWAVLVICAIAATLLLRILFFPHWDCSLQTLLALVFIPLIQGSWLRWGHALRAGWKAVFRLARRQAFLSALLLTEVVFFCGIAFPRSLWGNSAFGPGVAIWIGLKLVIFGSGLLMATMTDRLDGILRRAYGGGALICGIGVACTGRFPKAPWMMAALGLACILLEFCRHAHPDESTVGLARAAAEACLIPVVAMALCTLLTWVYPMDPLPWVAYSLMAFSTTFLAMAWRQNTSLENA